MRKLFVSFLMLLAMQLPGLKTAAGQIARELLDSIRREVNSNPEAVVQGMDSLIEIATGTGDSLTYARLLDIKGLAQRNTGDYAGALSSHHQAFSIYSSKGERNQAGGSLNNLGIVMIRTNQFEKAAGYLNDALKHVRTDDTVMRNVIYINLGVAYDYSGKTHEAINAYKKALLYSVSPGDPHSLGIIYHNIGVCYEVLGDYKLSEQYELKALEYQKLAGDGDLLARICISLGSLYIDMGDLKKAEQFYEQGGKAAMERKLPDLLEQYYQHLVELHILKKDSKKALLYMDSLHAIKEQIFNDQNLQNIAEAETKFKVDLKNREIENLKMSNALWELENQRNRLARNIMLVIITLGFVLMVILFWNYKLRRKNLDLLAREKQLIENEKAALEKNNEYLQSENILARFEILKSQVSPHFLFNTLNALSYLIESDPDKAVQFTNAFSKLYRTVLELKDQNLITLERELSHVEAYFFLQTTRFGNSLIIKKNVEEECLALKLPPFCIQLAVENAINHNSISDELPLTISVYCRDHFLFVENNLQHRTSTVRSTQVGIANIKSRYSYFTAIEPEFIKTDNSFIVKLPLLDQ